MRVRGGEELVSDIEAGHHQRSAVGEHGSGGLGIRPDVELADGGAIAERAAAHHRDPGDGVGEVGRPAQRQRNVRQRTDGDDPRARVGCDTTR